MDDLPQAAVAAAKASGDKLQLVWVLVVAAFFGLVRYLQEFVEKEPPPFKWFMAFIKVATSMAGGFLAALLCEEWGASYNITIVSVAVAGYGGAEVINAIKEAGLDYVRRKAATAK